MAFRKVYLVWDGASHTTGGTCTQRFIDAWQDLDAGAHPATFARQALEEAVPAPAAPANPEAEPVEQALNDAGGINALNAAVPLAVSLLSVSEFFQPTVVPWIAKIAFDDRCLDEEETQLMFMIRDPDDAVVYRELLGRDQLRQLPNRYPLQDVQDALVAGADGSGRVRLGPDDRSALAAPPG